MQSLVSSHCCQNGDFEKFLPFLLGVSERMDVCGLEAEDITCPGIVCNAPLTDCLRAEFDLFEGRELERPRFPPVNGADGVFDVHTIIGSSDEGVAASAAVSISSVGEAAAAEDDDIAVPEFILC